MPALFFGAKGLYMFQDEVTQSVVTSDLKNERTEIHEKPTEGVKSHHQRSDMTNEDN
jgi:hypothetical protein